MKANKSGKKLNKKNTNSDVTEDVKVEEELNELNDIDQVEEINDKEDLVVEENKNSEETTQPNLKAVFISGLPYTTTEEELRQKFETCGIIRQIKIPKYQDTGKNLGYAHIYFKKNSGVNKVIIRINFLALEMNNSYIGTRYINVALAKGENKEKRKFIF